ncbi:phage regulatory CII family protein [Undibacterium baiyunense]|uniref:Phage regulatory CII family protein n=1 Tax=Undibacterium baiyunense TaxID=2828731 RepID=A0A941DJP4_9BURK|nr:phage regulatory CII family protein [Undibacterium baiyunense]MBR7747432.1 phage regulatory CII family protein [Undibacterium baiyunense]
MTTPQDAFYQTCKKYPGGFESLAPRMGMSGQVLRNKANPNCAQNHINLSDVEQIMTLTGDLSILHALAEEQGCALVKVDASGNASDLAVLELVTKVWMHNGNVGAEVSRTLEDGRVEACEVEKVAEAVFRTTEALMTMLGRLRGMAEK